MPAAQHQHTTEPHSAPAGGGEMFSGPSSRISKQGQKGVDLELRGTPWILTEDLPSPCCSINEARRITHTHTHTHTHTVSLAKISHTQSAWPRSHTYTQSAWPRPHTHRHTHTHTHTQSAWPRSHTYTHTVSLAKITHTQTHNQLGQDGSSCSQAKARTLPRQWTNTSCFGNDKTSVPIKLPLLIPQVLRRLVCPPYPRFLPIEPFPAR